MTHADKLPDVIEPPHLMTRKRWDQMQNEADLASVTLAAMELADKFKHRARSFSKTVYTPQK